jgi:tetratricopeptide (TPR) repeat protein
MSNWKYRKLLLTFSLLLFGVFSLTACDRPEAKSTKYLEQAQAHFDAGRLDKALLDGKNSLQKNPKNVDAVFLLAKIAERRQDWPQMNAFLTQAGELAPERIDIKVKLAQFALLRGELEEARNIVETILTQQTDHPEALALRSATKLRGGDIAGAQSDGLAAWESEPGNASAATVLATVHASQKDFAKALEYLDLGLKKDATNQGLVFLKLQLLVTSGAHEQAEELYRTQLALQPENQVLGQSYVRYLVARDKVDVAIKWMEQRAADHVDRQDYQIDLVQFLHKYGSQEQAMQRLDSLIESMPKAYDLQFAKAQFLSNQPDKANEILNQIIAVDKDGPHALRARVQVALFAVRKGDEARAEQELNYVLERDPTNAEALTILGGLKLKRNETDAAIADFRSALEQAPDSTRTLLLLAEAHGMNNQPELRKQTLMKALEQNPNDEKLRLGLAHQLMSADMLQPAAQLLQQTLARNESNISTWILYIDVLVKQKQWEQAQQALDHMAQNSADEALVAFTRARVFRAMGNYSAAAKEYRMVLDSHPNHVTALTEFVQVSIADKRYAQAEKLLQERLKTGPKDIVSQGLLGGVWMAKGDFAAAESQFESMIQNNATGLPPYLDLVAVYREQNKPQKALQTYDRALKVMPNQLRLLLGKAQLLESMQNYDAAIATYRQVLVIDSTNVYAINNIAALVADTSTDQAALEEALKMVEALPADNNPYFVDTRAWLWYRLQQPEKTISLLEEILRRGDVDTPVFHYHLGAAYLANGQKEMAKSELNKAVPEDVKAYKGLEDARRLLEQVLQKEAS